jgi:hypothetical protein
MVRTARGSGAIARGWHPRQTQSWLIALASMEVDDAIREHRDVLHRAFPLRAPAMRQVLGGADGVAVGRGLALVDPRSRRREWLIPSRSDGRRSLAPYRDRGDAARVMGLLRAA